MCIYFSGLPTPFIGVSSTFSKQEEKSWLKSVHKLLPAEKIFSITNPGQISNLLRMISVSKLTIPKQWGLRSSLFIEKVTPYHALDTNLLHPNYVAANAEGHLSILEVTGVIRRKNLNPYKPVLISGMGTFKILRVDVTPNQIPKEFISPEQLEVQAAQHSTSSSLPPRFLYDPLSVPPEEVDPVGIDDEVKRNNHSIFFVFVVLQFILNPIFVDE